MSNGEYAGIPAPRDEVTVDFSQVDEAFLLPMAETASVPLPDRPPLESLHPFDQVARLKGDFLRIGADAAENYLRGVTAYPPETHPQVQAAHARWLAANKNLGSISTRQ